MDWFLTAIIIFSNHGEVSERHQYISFPQESYIECNKLKLTDHYKDMLKEMNRIPNVIQVHYQCTGLPKQEIKT